MMSVVNGGSGRRTDDSGDREASENGDDSVSDGSTHSHMDSSSPPPKRLKASDTVDRISSLPESVIVHILSFLRIADQIRTGALSRAWQYQWTRVPEIYFDQDYETPEDLNDFFQAVDKALFLCNGSRVKSFGAGCRYHRRYATKINSWTHFAAGNGIEILRLDLWPIDDDNPGEPFYELPQLLFTNSSFKELRFWRCGVNPRGSVSWKSLNKLSISCLTLSDELFGKIIAGCPELEVLDLCLFKNYYCLNFGNSSVKTLTLTIENECPHYPFEGDCGLEISAPNVRYLEISGDMQKCVLADVTSLVEASISSLDMPHSRKEQGILESLVHVQRLKLCSLAVKGIAMLQLSGLHISYQKCKCLTIFASDLLESDQSAIPKLLESFPEIETLILTMPSRMGNYKQTSLVQCCNSNKKQEIVVSQQTSSNFLGRLRIVRFDGLQSEAFPLVQFLLKNARLLQKMIIDLRVRCSWPHASSKKLLQVSRLLMSFPRSSPDAQLLFYE